VAIEALHSLYGRTHLTDEEFNLLVIPTFESEVRLLRRLYEGSMVDCHDIESTKYTSSKKFSEVSRQGAFLHLKKNLNQRLIHSLM
jgi:hypothetical protein